MSPAALKLAVAGVLALLLLAAGATWKVQDWRYGKQLAEQSGTHQADLTAISNAAADQVHTEQDKRLAPTSIISKVVPSYGLSSVNISHNRPPDYLVKVFWG